MIEGEGITLPGAVPVGLGTLGVLYALGNKTRSNIMSRQLELGIRSTAKNTKVQNGLFKAKPSTDFNGLVQFDLGQVGHSTFKPVAVKSEFPRIKPMFERDEVSKEDLAALHKELMLWIEKHYDVGDRLDYFQELAKACVLFSVYVNPFSKLFSSQMDLVIKTYFWLWYADDEIENVIENGIPFQSLQQGTDQLQQILEHGTNLKFVPVPDYPFFQPLFHSLVDVHASSIQIFPNYLGNSGTMKLLLERYFHAQRWFSADQIDERYSEETFRTWRRIIAYFDGIAAVVALAEGVNLSREIQTAPTFLRILDIANSFGGFVNDLLGMRKEFGNRQKDNLIIFKVLQKKIPLEVAVQQVCALMESELEDYMLMKQVILREFNNDADLVKYLDILESLIDGHNRIYAESTRHCSVGCITLTRTRN